MWQQDYGALFSNCSAIFDPGETVKRHAVAELTPDSRYLTNFLGVRIDPKFFPGILDGRAGQVEPPPLPANWHADLAEWAAALRAVDFARSTFRIIELGCGWACWLNCTGVAARRLGLKVELIGVEGDSGHVQFAHESLAANGFSSSEYRIIHGIAAPRVGKALFPNAGTSGVDWGAQPVFGAGAARIAIAKARGSHHVLDMIPFSTLAGSAPVDLLHIDIQGGEAALVHESLPELNRLVRRMVIGTHSRAIEGALMDTLTSAGWILEIERPTIYRLPEAAAPVLFIDGLQGWANPRL